MTDIVERLRFGAGTHVPIIDTMAEAADEIERLRAALRAIEQARRTTQAGTFRKQRDPAWQIARDALGMTDIVERLA